MLRYSVQRGSNPQGCEASRASARRSTLLAPKFYKIRRMADFLLRYSVQRGSNPQGNIPSSSSSGGVARVSVPGWSNPHRPQFGQHTPVTRTHQCPPHHTGPRANKVCVGGFWGRGASRAMTGGGVIRAPLVIAKERETLKTLSYDCGNPVIICLRASARSAFLFTGSPRSARDDKGD